MAGLAILVFAVPLQAEERDPTGDVAKVGDHQTSRGWVAVTEPVKDVAQIVFWVTVSVVTVLTYRRARKTLLQPIRTEVFKLQVEDVKPLFKIVVGKSETELRRYFGFDELLAANAIALLDDYARIRLGMEIDYKNRPYTGTTNKMVSLEGPGVSVHPVDTPGIPSELVTPPQDIRTPEQRWAEYRFAVIHLMPTYVKRSKRLQQFLESPMLPVECVELVRALKDTMHKNVMAMFAVLTETALELPKHFPTEKEMQQADIMWITNRYAGAVQSLKPDADKIVAFIRSHFGVDHLLKDD
jgi:hypothetical protein